MDKMLVVIFDSEAKAYDGSKALQELMQEGSINLYSKAVIARDASGKVEVKQKGDMGPLGTSVGLLTGGLLGLLGGPVGFAIGASTGTFGGLVFDMAHLGVGEDFFSAVEKYLQPGKAAVVAEVWEDWVLPVDTRMQELGGVVFRRTRKEVLGTVIERDVEGLKVELAELDTELDKATGEARGRLQQQVDTSKARLQEIQDGIQVRIETSNQETDAKIQSLREQAAKISGERKTKREARIAELQANQKRRSALLKRAWELTKEALSV